jgi:hypothetical protein
LPINTTRLAGRRDVQIDANRTRSSH